MSPEVNQIESVETLNQLFAASHTRPVFLFKHSVSCGVSAHIFETVSSINAVINLVVVQTHRDISREVESLTGYRHHSPQAFVIRNGRAVYHATHYAIDAVQIESHLNP